MSKPLVGFPIRSDPSVSLTPVWGGGSWEADLPIENVADRNLWKPARSTDLALSSTRGHVYLHADRSIRVAALVHTPRARLSPTARVRFVASPSTLLFDYEAGDAIGAAFTPASGATFTRASTATYHDANGVVQSGASGEARDAHFQNGARSALLEMASANLVVRSDELATGWTVTGTALAVNAFSTHAGRPFSRISNPAGGDVFRAVTLTGDGTKALSALVRTAGAAGWSYVSLYDATAGTHRAQIKYTVAADGTITAVAVVGTLIALDVVSDGVYRIRASAPGCVAANTNNVYANDKGSDATLTSVLVSGMQVENAALPTSLNPSAAATVTRNADTLRFPFTATPRAMTLYVKFTELGGAKGGGVIYVGNDAATGARLWIDGLLGNYTAHHDNGSTVDAIGLATGPTHGQTVELVLQLASTGQVTIRQSINGGAETTATTVLSPALAGAWSDTRLYVNSVGGTGQGVNAYQAVRVADGVQSMASMRSVVYDSGWLNAWPAGAVQEEDIDGMNISVLSVLPSGSAGARDWRFQIDDAANPAGYVDVPRVVFCDAYEASTEMSVGARQGMQSATVRTESDGDATFYRERRQRRTFAFSLPRVAIDEGIADAYALQRMAGLSRQLFLVADPDLADAIRQQTSFLGVLQQLEPFTWEYDDGNRTTVPFSIVEEL